MSSKNKNTLLTALVIITFIISIIALTRTVITVRKVTGNATALNNAFYDPSNKQLVNFVPFKDTSLTPNTLGNPNVLETVNIKIDGNWFGSFFIYWTNNAGQYALTWFKNDSNGGLSSLLTSYGLTSLSTVTNYINGKYTVQLLATTLSGTWSAFVSQPFGPSYLNTN